jgi:hypothetical protein
MAFKTSSSDGSEDRSSPLCMIGAREFLGHRNAEPGISKDGGGARHCLELGVVDVDVFC